MTDNQQSKSVEFQITTEHPGRLRALKAGGFGEGSKWDAAAKAAMDLRDQYVENKKRDPNLGPPTMKLGFQGKDPEKARVLVQDQITNRIRKMTDKRDVEKGGRLRVVARIAEDEGGNPLGLVVWAEPDFERPHKPRKKKGETPPVEAAGNDPTPAV
jgi:hypothetical protein